MQTTFGRHRHLWTEPIRELPQANDGDRNKTQPRVSEERVGHIATAYSEGKSVYNLPTNTTAIE